MSLSSIEVMALIVVVLAVLKLIIIISSPKAWYNVTKTIYGSKILTPIVALVLAVIVLKYLLIELTIVQIFAVMLFFMLLAAIAVSPYSKEMLALSSKLLKDRRIIMKAWLALIAWAVLIIWVLYYILA